MPHLTRREHLRQLAQPSSEEEAPIWMTVYSDMITNLMLFFLLMFSLNMIGKKRMLDAAQRSLTEVVTGQERLLPDAAEMETPESLEKIVRAFPGQDTPVQVLKNQEGLRLVMPEPVLFDPGRAVLKPAAKQFLHAFAERFKDLDNVLVVEGHTDDVPLRRGGPYASNWELSAARSESVVNYLVAEEGISPDRLAVSGYGEYWPFAPNDSDIHRALNRRIELLVIVDEKKPS